MNNDSPHISREQAPTLAHLFNERTIRSSDKLAYQQHSDGAWRSHSWSEVRQRVADWQAAMLRDGLQPGERVAIMCGNRVDWVVCDQAALGLGLVTVPVYTNDRAENIAWILQDSGARMLLLDTADQWDALQPIRETLQGLERIVCLARVDNPIANLRHVAEWAISGDGDYRCNPSATDELATIVYTSGTTGRPKGVMLSHQNIQFNIDAALKVFDVYEHDLMLSFLPLSHAFERTIGYYLPMACGTAVAYNRSIPQLGEDLAEVRPTLMISVPRIFERVYGKIMQKLSDGPALRRWLFTAAVETGWAHFLHVQERGNWRPSFLALPLLDLLVARKVRDKLGGRLRFTVCGGAALAPEIAKLFIGLGIPVVQGYGLTETAPVIAANPLKSNEPASVGIPLPGIEVKVGSDDELLTRSPSVMMGYWNNPAATAAMIDDDGWLHTGDKVSVSESGHVSITGRLKEIIVLSNGEKVPPADMENAIALDELVDQVLVIGEGRPYLSAIVVPNPDAFARALDQLHLDPANEASYDTQEVVSLLMAHVQDRTRSFPGYAKVRELAVVKEPWTPDNGLATPTLKLRRKLILERYHDIAERLYAGH